MHFPARYREPTQPRANALGRGPGGARRNRKARRHDPTGRPAKKCMRPQIEEAERRRMSHSRWWGSSNCGCKAQNGPQKETRRRCLGPHRGIWRGGKAGYLFYSGPYQAWLFIQVASGPGRGLGVYSFIHHRPAGVDAGQVGSEFSEFA